MIVPGFKFVHWDFDPERKGEIESKRVDMKAGLKTSAETDKATGYYFRWSVELYSKNGLFLHCVAEDSYRELRMTPPSSDKVWEWMNLSYEQFLEKFGKRMDIIGFEYNPVFILQREQATLLFDDFLREQ